jgi:hypothetical protein
MKALTALQRLWLGQILPEGTAPLPASVFRTLAEQTIAVRHGWIEVMGGVVGRDNEAVKQGLELPRSQGSEACLSCSCCAVRANDVFILIPRASVRAGLGCLSNQQYSGYRLWMPVYGGSMVPR